MNAPSKHSSKTFRVSVSPSGKLHLPAELRRELDMQNGGPLIASFEDGEIRLSTIRSRMEAARAMVAPYLKNDSVDQFLADRKAEARREWGEGN
jgi:bifunctional DNA-binding transcriptional regulator/antitoxin component of YhaV-PrlF toxin-antitoxin module